VAPVEVKLAAAVEPRGLAGLRQCMADLSLERGFVVYTGRERRSIGRQIELLPWEQVAQGDVDLPL
jgi:hypothetical protein